MSGIRQEGLEKLAAYREGGATLGSDLAKALLLAVSRSGGDRQTKAQFAAIVMREILAAVQRLRDSGTPSLLVEAYERACRQACRDELVLGLRSASTAQEAA